MFTKARIRLTILYSLLFLFFFWVFSIGIYYWMNRSIGEGTIVNQVKQQEQQGKNDGEFNDQQAAIVTTAGDIALNQLKIALLVLNGGLLFVIPFGAWVLTEKTLGPLQEIHEQQKQFASDVSHELRTPLSIMKGEIEVALHKTRSLSDYKQTLVSTKEETERLSNLVENLLFLTRAEKGKMQKQFSVVDITDVVGQVISNLHKKAEEKQITMKFTPPENSLVVAGEEYLLRQMIFNIIDNAIKYTNKKGRIAVTISSDKQHAIIKVKDTGLGINKEEQEKIFDRFYRIDASRSGTKGYGLGLSLVKSILDLHKGKIRVTSTIGKGTTFSVFLPLS